MNRSTINWRTIPAVIATILFGLGIHLSHLFELSIAHVVTSTLLIGLVVILTPIRYGSLNAKSISTLIILTSAGLIHSSLQLDRRQLDPNTIIEILDAEEIEGTVTHISYSEKYTNIHIVLTKIIKEGYGIRLQSKCSALIKVKKCQTELDLASGSVISCTPKFSVVPPSSGNTYLQYLESQNISFVGYSDAKDVSTLRYTSDNIHTFFRYQLRNAGLKIVEKNIADLNARSIIKALLFGDKSEIESSLKSTFNDSGTTHILAVSGLHTGIVAMLLFWISHVLLFWTSHRSVLRIVFIITGLVIFAELSGSSAPVWRATLMFSLFVFGRYFANHSSSLNLMGATALLLLIWDTQYLYDVGFQLSFSAVVGIILIYPILEKLYAPKGKILKYFVGIVYVGCAAQIALLPLTLIHFEQVSLMSPIASIVAIPIAFIAICSGTLLILADLMHLDITGHISSFIEGAIFLLTQSMQLIGEFSFAVIENIHITKEEAVLLAIGILFLALAFHRKSHSFAKVGFLALLIQSMIHFHHIYDGLDTREEIFSPSNELIEVHIAHTSILLQEEDRLWGTPARKKNKISKFLTLRQIEENLK